MAKWQSKNQIAENNPKWKGGYPRSYGVGWKLARKKVIKRNGGICERCNKSKSKDVHHKLPIRYFENKEDAHFDSNLIAVCHQCHADLHKELEKSLPLLDLLQSSHQKENPI